MYLKDLKGNYVKIVSDYDVCRHLHVVEFQELLDWDAGPNKGNK